MCCDSARATPSATRHLADDPHEQGAPALRDAPWRHPPRTKGHQTAPTLTRSYVRWGAPPGQGRRGPVGTSLRDGKPPSPNCGSNLSGVRHKRLDVPRPQRQNRWPLWMVCVHRIPGPPSTGVRDIRHHWVLPSRLQSSDRGCLGCLRSFRAHRTRVNPTRANPLLEVVRWPQVAMPDVRPQDRRSRADGPKCWLGWPSSSLRLLSL
jgi:hypothetical protein